MLFEDWNLGLRCEGRPCSAVPRGISNLTPQRLGFFFFCTFTRYTLTPLNNFCSFYNPTTISVYDLRLLLVSRLSDQSLSHTTFSYLYLALSYSTVKYIYTPSLGSPNRAYNSTGAKPSVIKFLIEILSETLVWILLTDGSWPQREDNKLNKKKEDVTKLKLNKMTKIKGLFAS